jgi:hypothetical protein
MGVEGWSVPSVDRLLSVRALRGSLIGSPAGGNERGYFKPVGEEEIVSVLIDARSFRRYEALANDDVTKTALKVLAFPFVREAASCRCTTQRTND